MGLHGIGKAIQRVGGKGQHGHQYGVDRHDIAAQTGAVDGQRAKAQLQQQGAQHDVAIQRQQTAHVATPGVFQHRQRHAAQRQHPLRHHQADNECGVLRSDRGQRRPLDVHPQAHHQPQVEHNIQQITDHQQNHRRPGVLDPQQPAEQHKVGQRRGSAEPADIEKPSRLLENRLAAADDMQGEVNQRQAKQDNQHPGAQRQSQRLHQRPRQSQRIFGPPGLSGQPGGAHAKKQQQHKQETGGRRSDRDAAEVYRAVKVADHRGIHQPQQRDGDIGENHGECKAPQRFIGSVEQHVRRPD